MISDLYSMATICCFIMNDEINKYNTTSCSQPITNNGKQDNVNKRFEEY